MPCLQKVKNYLGIAYNGGYVIVGQDKLKNYEKKMYLILLDKTAAKSSFKVAEKFRENQISIVEVENLQLLCNIPNCKVLGIKNKGLSDKIKENL